VFDAYGTLFDVNSAAARLGGELGAKAEPLSALWRRKQLENTRLRSLMGRHADFWQVTGEALAHSLATPDVRTDAVARSDLRGRLMAIYRRLDAYPEVPTMLAEVRRLGLATGILSNGSPAMLTDAVAAAGITQLLDAVLSVESVGIYKPHPSVYS